ncbi:UNVERIFIED_CONTAM: hypothetical protein Slati_0486400 [Sesamum latifolium]|uniref:GAG-pre-integrase domain-containing protein n=1 Tax=Sesamum latifolium TaxID=2727402 RepID=A0AAW2XWS6_9LAMI
MIKSKSINNSAIIVENQSVLPKKRSIENKPHTSTLSHPQVHLTENEEVITVVVVEGHLMEDKTDLISDTGPSKHSCSNKELFSRIPKGIRRNLISGSLLNKASPKIVLEADKVIISRNGDFVKKGYISDGLFVLSTVPFSNEIASSSAYMIESIDVWNGRLGHVNLASIKRLENMNLINTYDAKESTKCPICIEAKYVKKPSTRSTELLD